MRRSKITLNLILQITKSAIKESPKRKRRGRPRIYPDHLIISLMLYQTLFGLSMREVLEEAERVLPKVPSLSDFHYRAKRIPKEVFRKLIAILAKKFLLSRKERIRLLLCDGTGFGYKDLYPLRFLRGREVREVSSHVRIVPIVALTEGGKRVILSASSGGAYASEVKLLLEAMEGIGEFPIEGVFFVGDKCFDCIRVMEEIEKHGGKPAIKVKETWRKGVRHRLRKQSKRNFEKVGRERYLIESLFGLIKVKFGSQILVKLREMAERRALCMIVLYNLRLLLELGEISLLLCSFLLSLPQRIFRTASPNTSIWQLKMEVRHFNQIKTNKPE